MKKLLLLLTITAALSACADNKEKEKSILNDIIRIHDKVMAADDQLMNNKTQLDSMAKLGSTAIINDSIHVYLGKVNLTDSLMSEWMHKFDPEQAGKTDGQKLTYFTIEKKKIMSIDSQMSAVIEQSKKYIKNKIK